MGADSYGFLEVVGLITCIEAADAMVKSAHVHIVTQIGTDPGLITLVVEGDIGACAAALDAGETAAARVGRVVSRKLIGRPEPDLALFFLSAWRPVDAARSLAAVPPSDPPTGSSIVVPADLTSQPAGRGPRSPRRNSNRK